MGFGPSLHLGCHSPCLTVLFGVCASPVEYRKSLILWGCDFRKISIYSACLVDSGHSSHVSIRSFWHNFSFFPRKSRLGILGRLSSLIGVLASPGEYRKLWFPLTSGKCGFYSARLSRNGYTLTRQSAKLFYSICHIFHVKVSFFVRLLQRMCVAHTLSLSLAFTSLRMHQRWWKTNQTPHSAPRDALFSSRSLFILKNHSKTY